MTDDAQAIPPAEPRPLCFVIMPVSDPPGYQPGHFRQVHEDIVCPACDQAGFEAHRADQVRQSNLIHLDILQKLLDAPMAVCDLSTHNPNVLFELALRQAFDQPVALIQEQGTPQIFDIAPLRYTEYRRELLYHDVPDDQRAIAAAITDTYNAHKLGQGIHSIVRLLALGKPAQLPSLTEPQAAVELQKVILAEIASLREDIERGLGRHGEESESPAFVAHRLTKIHKGLAEVEGKLEIASLPLLQRYDSWVADLMTELAGLSSDTGSPEEICRLRNYAEAVRAKIRREAGRRARKQ